MSKSLLDFNSSMRRRQSSSGTVSDSQVAEDSARSRRSSRYTDLAGDSPKTVSLGPPYLGTVYEAQQSDDERGRSRGDAVSYDVELKRRNSDTDTKQRRLAVAVVQVPNCLSVRATSVPRPRGYPMVTCGKGRPRTPSVRLPDCLALPASCRGKGVRGTVRERT